MSFCVCFDSVGDDLTGNTNLITHYNLEHAYNKFCGKKVKEKLSNFLPELPGEVNVFVFEKRRCISSAEFHENMVFDIL